MDTATREQGIYTISVEGATVEALREYMTNIVTHWSEGESQEGLITATPEQVAKLRELLRVRQITPADDGIYVGYTGSWHVVKGGTVADSGHWMIPEAVLRSFRDEGVPTTEAPRSESPTVEPPVSSAGSPGGAIERDPVCGMALKPGQEEANTTYQDRTFHFCSAECRDIFLKSPTQYIKGSAAVS